MHEMSIAQSLLEIIRDEMKKHDAKVLRSVRLHIGKLTAIVPESLSFCFEIMTTGTDLEGAKLIMEIIPLVGHCEACHREFEIQDYAFTCPHCGSPDIKTISGEDLSIVEMEVE
ncbi:MAG: hydrogenase maturation nickel metallochaperone HypA [Deltaproteobacteria bacterium]|nr:hydrogenase maturation nickel metallochaperone HypA [Deltaproteobacteria bacterium]MBW1930650.1 hydrogenase maturation nickel metallochaperone HypA [Deltaproteobacteria bacterium]MBW2023937.1 hydrogenase maturation nickel metallochaperone HypA [Deltaproteobacteria bacterium]MBW2124306.1 hydrogenase maturation nickel metallochaperone HypA [Deltaproteobacteria bacterium]RLB15155.1 MAG: hydrogenase maturation nickel metallochaperone HypA [Deltaproteobacteria bacterium]